MGLGSVGMVERHSKKWGRCATFEKHCEAVERYSAGFFEQSSARVIWERLGTAVEFPRPNGLAWSETTE